MRRNGSSFGGMGLGAALQVSGPPDRLRAAHLTAHCGWWRGIRHRVVPLVNGVTHPSGMLVPSFRGTYVPTVAHAGHGQCIQVNADLTYARGPNEPTTAHSTITRKACPQRQTSSTDTNRVLPGMDEGGEPTCEPQSRFSG